MAEWLATDAMWSSIFTMGAPLVEKIVRPILVYFFLVLMLRVFGKRELAQLNPFDLVVLLSLSNTVQNAIIGDDNSLLGGLIGAVALLSTNYLVVRFLFRHRRLDQIFEGSPTTLIDKGKLVPRNLSKEMMTRAELQAVAHRQGFELDDIEECRLEPGGVFYIRAKKPNDDETRHAQVMQRLDSLQQQISAIAGKAQ